MKKIISYSLFGHERFNDENKFVFDKYVLGVYFNARMNRLIYPDWQTEIQVDEKMLEHFIYQNYFADLQKLFPAFSYTPFHWNGDLCRGMIQRIAPVYYIDDLAPRYVLCRDLDTVCTHKESLAAALWINSGKMIHSINDNSAHSGLMGGLIGIDTKMFHESFNQYNTLENLIRDFDLSKHGSDQHLLNQRIGRNTNSVYYGYAGPASVSGNPLWESDLTIATSLINFIMSSVASSVSLMCITP